jgi:hypothetical protein
MTVRGCQQRLRQDYMVVDRHGFPCALKGVGDKRNADVGHEVEVTGTLTDAIRTSTRSEKQGQQSGIAKFTVDIDRQSTTIWLWINWVQHLRLCLIQPGEP